MTLHKLVRRNYGGKLPVSIRYHNLHSFKEGVILLCQSILETRRISNLYGSALFAIPLSTITIAHLLYLLYLRPCLDLGYLCRIYVIHFSFSSSFSLGLVVLSHEFRYTRSFAYFLEYVLLFSHEE